ncbi:MAG: hypothetical protein MRY32_00455 [Rickettsiales bacterium]|nr:hypothetical protein [Rickettsiales bacterium]
MDSSWAFLLLTIIVTLMIGLPLAARHIATLRSFLLADFQSGVMAVAISAIVTNASAFMFIGQIGFVYLFGYQAILLAIGWKAGDFIASIYVHRPFREHMEKTGSLSYAEAMSIWQNSHFYHLQKLSAIGIVLMLTGYAAAQLSAVGMIFHHILEIPVEYGGVAGFGLVLLYIYCGGMRASQWTDILQAAIIVVTSTVLLLAAMSEIGGVDAFWSALHKMPAEFQRFAPQIDDVPYELSCLLFVTGWVLGGVGVIGQPHIMLRFATLKEPTNMLKARLVYLFISCVFSVLTISLGLATRLLLPELSPDQAELALPMMADQLLPQFGSALLLIAILAAALSTIDSQLLTCSGCLSRDIFKQPLTLKQTRYATILVALAVLLVALWSNQTVFDMVLLSWSALASAFAPLLLLQSIGRWMNESTAIAVALFGLASMLMWKFMGFATIFYPVGVGLLGGFVAYGVLCMLNKTRTALKSHN